MANLEAAKKAASMYVNEYLYGGKDTALKDKQIDYYMPKFHKFFNELEELVDQYKTKNPGRLH